MPYLGFLRSTRSRWRDGWSAHGSTSLVDPHLRKKRDAWEISGKQKSTMISFHNEIHSASFCMFKTGWAWWYKNMTLGSSPWIYGCRSCFRGYSW
jgi:hypothetical protein